jgi:hypothetical protein
MVREEMFSLWPNNCFIVVVLLNDGDKETFSLNVPFCEFAQQVLFQNPFTLFLAARRSTEKEKIL